MDGFMKPKIMRNLVILEKCLNLNDQFKQLSLQYKIFSQRINDDIMKDESTNPNTVCDIASNKQIETRKLYNMNG